MRSKHRVKKLFSATKSIRNQPRLWLAARMYTIRVERGGPHYMSPANRLTSTAT